jgi:hypothetical protein
VIALAVAGCHASGGAGSDGGGGAVPDLGSAPFGSVSIQYDATDTSVLVKFDDGNQQPCVTTTIGACTVSHCPSLPHPILQNAGVVTLTIGGQALTFTADASNNYAAFFQQGQDPWPPGTSMAIDVAGMGAIAHVADTLVVPTPSTITSPAGMTVSRAADLTLTWSGGTDLVDVTVVSPPGGVGQVECLFPASAGRGVIPAAAFANYGAGASSLIFSQLARKQKAGGDRTVTLASLRGDYAIVGVTFD